MRHRAARSLMTPCPFHSTLDEVVGLSAGVNTNRQRKRVSRGPLAQANSRAEKKNLEGIRSKQVFELSLSLVWLSHMPPIQLTGLLYMTVCFCRGCNGVGGPYYIWQIHARKWSCALLTHRLKRLIDCGSWLTLERRQPVSLFFSFTFGSFLFPPTPLLLRNWSGRCTIWHESRRRRAAPGLTYSA